MVDDDEARTAQAGSPIALLLFDLLADPSSTLRGLLRVSDLFCVRLTCREAWRCIQDRPLSRSQVLMAAKGTERDAHHVPLLRWCLRNGIMDQNVGFYDMFGESGDTELVSEALEVTRGTGQAMHLLAAGAARAGHDSLALRLVEDYASRFQCSAKSLEIEEEVATGGCLLTAAAIDDDPSQWLTTVHAAVTSGQLRFAQWLLADFEPLAALPLLEVAVGSGSLDLVTWLYAKGWPVDESRAVWNALFSGNFDMLHWALDRGFSVTEEAMEGAVVAGHIHMLEWYVAKGGRCSGDWLETAVTSCRVPVVDWLLDHCTPPDGVDLLVLSCGHESGTDVFEYLFDKRGFRSNPEDLMAAAAVSTFGFDVAVVLKRYPQATLDHEYLETALDDEDVGRTRFALSQGLVPSVDDNVDLLNSVDSTLLSEVLIARKVDGTLPEVDRARMREALPHTDRKQSTMKILREHSFFDS